MSLRAWGQAFIKPFGRLHQQEELQIVYETVEVFPSLCAFSYHRTNSLHGIEGTHDESQTIRCNSYPYSTNALSNRPQIIVLYYPAHPQSIISSFAQVHIPNSHNRTPTTTTSGHATCTTSQCRIFSMMLLHYNHLSRGLSRSIIWLLLLMMSAKSSILLVGVLRRALALVALLWRANVLRCLLFGVACGSLLLLLLLVVVV